VSPISHPASRGARRTSKLAATYALLAVLATAANIGAQDLSLYAYGGAYSVVISVFVGTLVGLLVKYVLDKRYIFAFKATSASHDVRTFMMYTLMGVATTVIFWGFEFAFDHLFHTKAARLTGGAIGLAIGYVTKYLLDRKFVFVQDMAGRPSQQ
jgi:hypothetical protein